MRVLAVWNSAHPSWLCLWNKVFFFSRHAVVIRPAVNLWQVMAPVTMLRRRIWCLPLKSRGTPGVVTGFFALKETPNHVNEEEALGCGD